VSGLPTRMRVNGSKHEASSRTKKIEKSPSVCARVEKNESNVSIWLAIPKGGNDHTCLGVEAKGKCFKS